MFVKALASTCIRQTYMFIFIQFIFIQFHIYKHLCMCKICGHLVYNNYTPVMARNFLLLINCVGVYILIYVYMFI